MQELHYNQKMNYHDQNLRIDQTVAKFQHLHGRKSWEKKVFNVLDFYTLKRRQQSRHYSAFRCKRGQDLTHSRQYKQAEKLLAAYLTHFGSHVYGIEHYISWVFDYALLFFKTNKTPYLNQFYSERLLKSYQFYRQGLRPKATAQKPTYEAVMASYKKTLYPIWGDQWESIAQLFVQEGK